METLAEIAKRVESQIHDDLGFDMDEAVLYGITLTNGGPVVNRMDSSDDIYGMLEGEGAKFSTLVHDCIAIVTTGWASPVPPVDEDDDGIDGAIAMLMATFLRRRIRVAIIAKPGDSVGVLRFADEPDEVIVEEGHSGQLHDAIEALFG